VKKIHSQIDENMVRTSWKQVSLLYPTFHEEVFPSFSHISSILTNQSNLLQNKDSMLIEDAPLMSERESIQEIQYFKDDLY